ncbi:hypothetical protein RJ639_008029, partial [Escallonia herrerae]
MEESMDRTARKIFLRLRLEEKLLLILDDVWEAVDLDRLGVPELDDRPGWKLLLTSRSLDVCRYMKTDEDIKVGVLDVEESWKLFTQNAGKVVNLENIEPVAKQVARECGGLPLLINIVGASMRGKKMVQLWEDALSEMGRSPVYKPLKWSYDALEGTTIKSCFLFCALYPEDFSIDVKELASPGCYEESTNRGIALIENLKDSCLLERGKSNNIVRMHDVVRDRASWISSSSSSEDGCKAFVRSGLGLTNFPENKKSPEVSTLLLQGNHSLTFVPEGFLTAFKSLKVLNLNRSRIKILPQSLLQLRELRALLLRRCFYLEELPLLGGFTKLQVLDCGQASRIKELPQGIEELKLEKFPESLGRNVCDGALRFLTIAYYNGQFPSSNAGFCQIPNLELLELFCVDHLESISQLASTLGLEFSKLRTIEVDSCEKLKYLFSVGGSTAALEHL